MNEFLENLKRQAQENPMLALAAGGAFLSGVTKFIYAQVWAKEVARRKAKL
jgi:hypothetical protein